MAVARLGVVKVFLLRSLLRRIATATLILGEVQITNFPRLVY